MRWSSDEQMVPQLHAEGDPSTQILPLAEGVVKTFGALKPSMQRASATSLQRQLALYLPAWYSAGP